MLHCSTMYVTLALMRLFHFEWNTCAHSILTSIHTCLTTIVKYAVIADGGGFKLLCMCFFSFFRWCSSESSPACSPTLTPQVRPSMISWMEKKWVKSSWVACWDQQRACLRWAVFSGGPMSASQHSACLHRAVFSTQCLSPDVHSNLPTDLVSYRARCQKPPFPPYFCHPSPSQIVPMTQALHTLFLIAAAAWKRVRKCMAKAFTIEELREDFEVAKVGLTSPCYPQGTVCPES